MKINNWELFIIFSLIHCLSGCSGNDSSISGIDGSGIIESDGSNSNSISGIDGSGVTDPNDDSDISGIDGSGIINDDEGEVLAASGPIDGFGSVIVNGVTYNTSSAAISVRGESSIEDNLQIGDNITVLGTLNTDGLTGTATKLVYQPNLIGPISQINSNDTFSLIAQTVIVNNATIFGSTIIPRNIHGLSEGQVVEVSGVTNSNGEIVATRIDVSTITELEIIGTVSELDLTEREFKLESTVIDYSGLTDSASVVNALENGLSVIVRGTSLVGTNLTASSISIEENIIESNNVQNIQIEGLVESITDTNNFKVNGFSVQLNETTEFSNGSAEDIIVDTFLEVEGTINVSENILTANQVNIINIPEIISVGAVNSILTSDQSGTITINSGNILVNDNTIFVDNTPFNLKQFSLSDIGVGDFIVASSIMQDTDLVATLIEREDLATLTTVEVSGSAINVSEPSFEVNGNTILPNASADYEVLNQAVNSTVFYTLLSNSRVDVTGTITGSNITADTLNINAIDSGVFTQSFDSITDVTTFTQASNEAVEIILDSKTSLQYGRIKADTLTLDGVLVITVSGITMTGGENFLILQGAISGTFDSIILPPLPAGLEWNIATIYTDGRIRVKTI